MKLVIAGNEKETLMFRLLGVSQWKSAPVIDQTGSADNLDYAAHIDEQLSVLLGPNEAIPLDSESRDSLCYVRLPESDHVDMETQRLCRLLAQAVGQKEIHL